MTLPLTMSGYERTYRPPRSLREHVGAEVTAWDLFRLEHDEQAGAWAASTLASVVASADAESAGALGCTECLDTGFYGAASPDDPDLLLTLVRRFGDSDLQSLTTDGSWEAWGDGQALEVLDLETAADLAGAITAGASGLLRLYGQPRAFLPPVESVTMEPLAALVSAAKVDAPQSDSPSVHALVHEADQGAVLELLRVSQAGIERYDDGEWVAADDFDDDLPTVELDESQLNDVLGQLTAATLPTVSPDPRAARLRRYWSHGRGAAKLRWKTPGDWTRCYRHLRKYMGLRAKAYCANLHVMNTGVWPGSRFNVGRRGGLLSSATPEVALLAALRSGRVSGDTEGKTTMPDTLTDGVYTETDSQIDALLAAIEAKTIPVAAPDDWFDDPKLDRPTTVTVTDEGRVYGHIAPWGVTHIGMAGGVTAPPNPDGKYAYFRTGQYVTASGKSVRVGQFTLTGGHAPMEANVASVVKHYDDTNSAVADVAVGEDKYGIWAAGVLRPSVTPDQVRVMRASPPSGDWRRINGQLELVAACHVNVQGLPIAACAYHAGTVEALVAAGARQMAQLGLIERADAAVVSRLDRLDQLVASLAASETAPAEPVPDPVPEPDPSAPQEPPPASEDDNPAAAETQEPEVEFTEEELARAAKIARAREEIASAKRDALRARVNVTAAAMPEQFKAHVKGKDGSKAKSTIKGTDSFPIGNVADLKRAIQAFGRAGDKPAAKKHIMSMAYKLKRPDLIPDNWRGGK